MYLRAISHQVHRLLSVVLHVVYTSRMLRDSRHVELDSLRVSKGIRARSRRLDGARISLINSAF